MNEYFGEILADPLPLIQRELVRRVQIYRKLERQQLRIFRYVIDNFGMSVKIGRIESRNFLK